MTYNEILQTGFLLHEAIDLETRHFISKEIQIHVDDVELTENTLTIITQLVSELILLQDTNILPVDTLKEVYDYIIMYIADLVISISTDEQVAFKEETEIHYIKNIRDMLLVYNTHTIAQYLTEEGYEQCYNLYKIKEMLNI